MTVSLIILMITLITLMMTLITLMMTVTEVMTRSREAPHSTELAVSISRRLTARPRCLVSPPLSTFPSPPSLPQRGRALGSS